MGTNELTKTDAALDGFLSQVSSVQNSLIHAINSNEPLRAAFAEAEAKLILLEGITPEVGAYLLRFCDKKLDMVEVVNTTDNETKTRCVAMAILNGFVPGKEQFGIHTNKLYVKENGYRKLFSNLAGCGVPDVQVGHPDLADLGNGRKVWKVDGVASVVWRGEEYRVECVRDFAIGIPSHGTDHIDGIKTKARRRLLQLLWKKVSSVGLDDSEVEFEPQETVMVVPVKAIDATEIKPAKQEKTEQELVDERIREDVSWEGHRSRIAKMLSRDESAAAAFQDVWTTFASADSLESLDKAGGDLKELIHTFSDDVQKKIRGWFLVRHARLGGKAKETT